MLFAQSLGEYGALGDVVARITTTFESVSQWVQGSLREDTTAWIVAAVVVVGVVWLFRRR